ncbi:MAG: O-methyltransferase [Anaerolineales bacterium]
MENVALPIVPQVSDDLLERYALQMLKLQEHEEESPLQHILNEIEETAEKESIPIIGALEGRILSTLISMICPAVREALDIGTAVGYSALWLAKVIGPGGHITTIEIDPVRAERAREYVRRAGVQERVEIITGDFFDVIPQQKKKYDVIFQDVMKHVYFAQDPTLALKLLDISVAHLEIGGVLLTDNAFCQGKVLHSSEYNQVKGIQAYNEAIATHKQLDSILFPLRDGLWFSRSRA